MLILAGAEVRVVVYVEEVDVGVVGHPEVGTVEPNNLDEECSRPLDNKVLRMSEKNEQALPMGRLDLGRELVD